MCSESALSNTKKHSSTEKLQIKILNELFHLNLNNIACCFPFSELS